MDEEQKITSFADAQAYGKTIAERHMAGAIIQGLISILLLTMVAGVFALMALVVLLPLTKIPKKAQETFEEIEDESLRDTAQASCKSKLRVYRLIGGVVGFVIGMFLNYLWMITHNRPPWWF